MWSWVFCNKLYIVLVIFSGSSKCPRILANHYKISSFQVYLSHQHYLFSSALLLTFTGPGIRLKYKPYKNRDLIVWCNLGEELSDLRPQKCLRLNPNTIWPSSGLVNCPGCIPPLPFSSWVGSRTPSILFFIYMNKGGLEDGSMFLAV